MSKNYKYIKIRLASPEEILSWSHGEVKKHETINYRTLKPEPDGLFCEKIFGPTKDYQCACGKSKRNDIKGRVCEKCGVEITESKVRRERMGHIKLASPVVHAWFLRNSPSRLAILLDLKAKELDEVVYLASYIVTNPGSTDLKKKQVISEAKYSEYYSKYGRSFEALTGAEAIKKLLQELDLKSEVAKLRKDLNNASKQTRDKAIKRLEVCEAFLNSDNKPEWMILEVLPVIPPDIRPMVQLDGGRFATTDLNDLYRRILNRNNRLKKQYEQNAPHLITKNEKRMLQEAVDALIDNSKRGRKNPDSKNRHLKSLSDMLRGKQGRFRQNLLGKRVDYSGRSVIVVGPFLKMYQCGIPKEMALTLFKPFVIRDLIGTGLSISAAKKACEQQQDSVWKILENVIREHPVLLNRAPTLHRLGIQAFEPILIEGKAIRLHPLVTTAFNADFDGDQMAVHVPLSNEAQAEARLLMLASNNILNPKDGKPVVTPSQDMILGNYYLTLERKYDAELQPKEFNEGTFYTCKDAAYLAYKNDEITLHTRIFVDPSYLPSSKFDGVDTKGKYLFTTLGKMIFNEILPEDFPYVNEPTDANLNDKLPSKYLMKPSEEAYNEMLSHDEVAPFNKKFIAKIIARVFKCHQMTETSKMLDRLKDLGFYYSTVSGITISAADVAVYDKKDEMIVKGDKEVEHIKQMFDMGLVTDKERSKLVAGVWKKIRDDIEEGLWKVLQSQKDNHIFMMADSGSRGSRSNFAQLAGMRGLMNNPTGDVIEVPVKANFKEGLTVSEFFISTHGARKGSTDTALKTAQSGYLTRRLVDVSQDVIVSQEDCGTEKGFYVSEIKDAEGKKVVGLSERIIGRFLAKDVINPKTGEVMAKRNEIPNEDLAKEIEDAGVTSVCIRSNITCNSKFGVCMKCYGRNLATNKIVEVGEAVGTVAAQSIGEPGTQLTMRTFHSGGVASTADITQGLPRVEELFEARNPKGKAQLSEIDGTVVSIEATKAGQVITIEGETETKTYTVDMTSNLLVQVGDVIKRGTQLMSGSIAPRELLRICDATAVQKYIIEEVQKVYRSQGVEISDKHIEIIVRQMMRKLRVEKEGSTKLIPGRDIFINDYKAECKKVIENGGTLPIAKQLLLGITKAALASNSFLSAASFQETTRILTDAAIRGKEDYLFGLKENIIIGGLIPAGTGTLMEESFECEHKPVEEAEDSLEEEENNDMVVETTDEELEDEDIIDDEVSDENLE
ncbi:MAG: DNA-directed RNA polymerase subunit beta' [Anaeroplasmataceae bacterium]